MKLIIFIVLLFVFWPLALVLLVLDMAGFAQRRLDEQKANANQYNITDY